MVSAKKKPNIYGVIAVIFFFVCIVIMLAVVWLTGTSLAILYIIRIIYFVSAILFIVFTILAVYAYITNRKKTAPIKHAVKVLYERYAKGEISKEELEQMKKDIEE